MKRKFIVKTEYIRESALSFIRSIPLEPNHEITVREHKTRRSLEQNDKLWAMLTDIAKQVEWYGQHLVKEEWKDVLTAGLKKQRAVPGIDGGFVILGAHTSKMSVKDMIDLIDLAYAFGNEHGVKWTEPDHEGMFS